MSVKVMSWVWDHSRSVKTGRLVLLAIADCASEDGGNAYPSMAELMRKTGLSERGVQQQLATLVSLGELVVSRNGGPRGCNRYRVVMETPAESAPPQTVRGAKRAGGARRAGAESAPPAARAPLPPQTVRETPANGAPGTVLEPSLEPSVDLPAASQPATVIDAEIVNDIPGAALALAEPNAGEIVAGWIDHCKASGVVLPKRLIGHYAKGIGDALKQGFPADLVKHALALMLDEGESNRPSLLDNYLVRVQQGRSRGQRRLTPGERAQQQLAQDPEVRGLLSTFFDNTEAS